MAEITKATINDLSKDLMHTVRAWTLGKGLLVTKVGGTYDPTIGQWTTRITFKAETVAGKTQEEAEFGEFCVLYGLKPHHYKQRFTMHGTEYALIGFNRKKRLPIVGARVSDNKKYVFERRVLDQILLKADAK